MCYVEMKSMLEIIYEEILTDDFRLEQLRFINVEVSIFLLCIRFKQHIQQRNGYVGAMSCVTSYFF